MKISKQLYALLLFASCILAHSQKNYWSKEKNFSDFDSIAKFNVSNDLIDFFQLDIEAFKVLLFSAPSRLSKSNSNVIVQIPSKSSGMLSFELYEAPVFDHELSQQFPEIKSFVGYSTSKTKARLRMSISPLGVETMVRFPDGNVEFIQPVWHYADTYMHYDKKASKRSAKTEGFECLTENATVISANRNTNNYNRAANDQVLRTFRLAISTTGEYTQYYGGTVTGALSGINATVGRINEIFEVDMAVSFQVIASSSSVIYTNGLTDPYSFNLNSELQNTLTNNIGESNYDIGHLMSGSGGGGSAGCIGCVCVDGQKGSGYTSSNVPQGDAYDIDYVAHEIGHQMGANHTFSHVIEGTGVNVEPGSGSTIMGYAGITSSNVQNFGDAYFHYVSIDQILTNLQIKTCWNGVTITNSPPVANAGNDYTIPQGTAYVLRGSATDPNINDNLSYCWEQIDNGRVAATTFGPTTTLGAQNRSLLPVSSPNRYIPKLSRVLAGQLTETNPTIFSDWETVSTVGRTLNWSLTVRDQFFSPQQTASSDYGQSSFDTMQITVDNSTAFSVITPGTLGSTGSNTVNWVVGQTNITPINCQLVNIKLSIDNGLSFPYELAMNTENDGSQSIALPSLPFTNSARIMVEASDNIFYAISEAFTISNSQDFSISNLSGAQSACNQTSLSYALNYATINNFSETVTFSVSGLPSGVTAVFDQNNLSSDTNFSLQLENIENLSDGDYSFDINAAAVSISKNITLNFNISSSICASEGDMEYLTSTTGVVFNSINNLDSGKPGPYSDYTALSTDVNTGDSYDLSVYVDTDGNYQTYTNVWIDWNQNCQFDSNETYDLGGAANVVNNLTDLSPLSVNIPQDATPGTTTMRVSTKYFSYPGSCEIDYDGEVEDYSINVIDVLNVIDFEIEEWKLFPNPAKNLINIRYPNNQRPAAYAVYNMLGQKIIINNTPESANSFSIDISDFEKGVYFVKLHNSNQTKTIPFIKK